MTERSTDRYLREGGLIPRIYPGTLPELLQAIEDIKRVSGFNPRERFALWAIKNGERSLVKTYVAGKEIT